MDGRRIRLALAAILVVAFALRLAYVMSQRSDVLFEHPVLDETSYVDAARGIVAGHVQDKPYWQPPGIIYVLAACFEISDGLLLPRLLQVLISVATCGLAFLIGRRLFNVRVGLAAAAILALHGVLVFECYELLPATWIVFFDTLALWLSLRAAESRAPLAAFATGLAIGVSAIFAPTILPFAVIAAIAVRKPIAIAALVVGVVLPIAPVTMRNYRHGGEVVLVSANSGLNLYLGNNADYRTTFALRPGRHWEELTSEGLRRGITKPGAQSSYYQRKARSFVAHHPGSALVLTGRKLYLFFHGAEVPRDTDLYAARRDSWLLAVLVWPLVFPDGLLIPAALIGIALLWRERRRLALPLALLAMLAIVTAIFFVSSRHRAPALPLFALFAAAGAAPLVERWRSWPLKARVLASVGIAALVVALNIPTFETQLSYAGELDFYRGIAMKNPDDKRAAFERATAANPNDPRAWFELGNALQGPDAIAAWQHAVAADPWDSRARRRIAGALVQQGDIDGAIATLQQSIDAHLRDDAHYAPDHLNLAFLHIQRGNTVAAIDHLRAAARADINYVHGTLPRMASSLRGAPNIDPAFLQAVDEVLR